MNPTTNCRPMEVARLPLRRRGRSTTGSFAIIVSHTTRPMMPARVSRKKATMAGEPNQSDSWPLSRKTCRAPKASTTKAKPMASTRMGFFGACSLGGSWMSRWVSRRDTRPTGTFMKKIQRQEKLSVIQPPRVGPMAGATTTAMP